MAFASTKKSAEERWRTAIVGVRLPWEDHLRAHEACHAAAKLWERVRDWVFAEWETGRSPRQRDMQDFITSIPRDQRPLHAHTTEMIAHDYADALATFRENRKAGRRCKPPWRDKNYRPLSFSAGYGWRVTPKGRLSLSLGRGRHRLLLALPTVTDPATGEGVAPSRWGEIKLCWDRDSRRWGLHVACLTGLAPVGDPAKVVAIDEGIINPMTLASYSSDSTHDTPIIDVTVINGREGRAVKRDRSKAVGSIQRAKARCKPGSRRHKALSRAGRKHKARANRRLFDFDHQVAAKACEFVTDHEAGRIGVGDVRGIEQRTRQEHRARRSHRQQLSQWSRGRQEDHLEHATGVKPTYVDEAYSSKTCPMCLEHNRPRGRNYRCRRCGFSCNRDAVGAINILMAFINGTYVRLHPDTQIRVKYLRSVPRWNRLQREAHRQVQRRRSNMASSDRDRSNAENPATDPNQASVIEALADTTTARHSGADLKVTAA